jgi:hypothetical protein
LPGGYRSGTAGQQNGNPILRAGIWKNSLCILPGSGYADLAVQIKLNLFREMHENSSGGNI